MVDDVRVPALAVALAVVVSLTPRPAAALSLAPMSLAQVVDEADRIVHGTVTDVQSGRDERGLPATWVTVRVARMLKGAAAGEVRFKQFGVASRTSDGRLPVPFLPRYRRGSEVVLLLRAPSRHGFTSPVEPSLGFYEIAADSDARGGSGGAAPARMDRAELDRLWATLERLVAGRQ
jgi:hypothetical protein